MALIKEGAAKGDIGNIVDIITFVHFTIKTKAVNSDILTKSYLIIREEEQIQSCNRATEKIREMCCFKQ